jgi:cell wall-associated NlpC family hydrolase
MSKPTRAQFVAKLLELYGTPYIWGGRDKGGLDCWGVGAFAYFQACGSKELFPWWTDKGFDKLPSVGATDLGLACPADIQAGDCVFYGPPHDITHVAWWIGAGVVLSASNGGSNVKTVEDAKKRKAFTMAKDTYMYRPDVRGFRSMGPLFK